MSGSEALGVSLPGVRDGEAEPGVLLEHLLRPRSSAAVVIVTDELRYSVPWFPPLPGRALRWLLAPVWWSILFGIVYAWFVFVACRWAALTVWRRAAPIVRRHL